MIAEMSERLELLAELGEVLARRRDDLVAAQGEDMGAPCTIAGQEVDLAVAHLKSMAEETPYVEGKSPYGTVAAIFPYDAPPIMLGRVGGAALLGGNRFRFSCSSVTPRSARLLQEVVAPFPGDRSRHRPGQPGIRQALRARSGSAGAASFPAAAPWATFTPKRRAISISSSLPAPAACRR